MKHSLTLKFLAITAISLVLVLALGMVEFKVKERKQYKQQAKLSIAKGWSGAQTIVNPVMRLTYRKVSDKQVFDKNLKEYVTRQHTSRWVEFQIPDRLEVNGSIAMQDRYLGIYQIPVYETELSLSGQFSSLGKLPAEASDTTLEKTELILSISDMRGFDSTPRINWNDKEVGFEAGKDTQLLGNYISALVNNRDTDKPATFSMNIKLRGLDSVHFVPAAKQVTARLESTWQHPYFEGQYLPVKRDIGKDGFVANWAMTEFSTSIQKLFTLCSSNSEPHQCQYGLRQNSFGVGLHNPIDIYQKTDRSLKYGFLFILLTFLVFCLFEVIKRVHIHPVQYALVGASLALFYLILISLSEHTSFGLSYLLASLCCITLIGSYLRFALNSKSSSVVIALGLGTLYGMLYMILKSEDFALLMGTALTFACLSSLMIATRNIDWYSLLATSNRSRPAGTDASDSEAARPEHELSRA